jgi:anthranilate synthase/indole-3-glycerol phosphate synthase/phosphoribosylanthranilate isomerase
MLDSGTGGSGTRLDTKDLHAGFDKDPELKIFLAGGLNPENVSGILEELDDIGHHVVGVCVSGGVEENGQKSVQKIQKFISAAKSVR